MACQLDWLTAITIDDITKSKFEHFYGIKPKFTSHLRTFGQLGVITIASRNLHSKTDMRGLECMMVGYATKHAGDVYRMYDPVANVIYTTRDVKWHDKMYFQARERKENEVCT